MKRWIILIMVLFIILGMMGCGGEAKEPEAAPEPTATPAPKMMMLTNSMIEEIKTRYGDGMMCAAILNVAYGRLIGISSIASVNTTQQEKFDSYTYVFYYTLNCNMTDYSHKQYKVRYVITAYEDSSEAKGYRFDEHCYEGTTKLW